ncbi:short-chain dehydrogenase/reductase SDRA-like isoform X2 [Aristolochia californica]|uniref:short-chain dehydrogenase/reductase SDRA-like isoform X2 n=1 Tax=Aristolochia californica TaxID=171875 RepID=UPI0035E2A5F6
MMKRFQGKVAIVTASTQGIGFGIAQRLGSEGASVVVSSRKQKNVDEAVEKLRAQGIDALGVVCHVSNAQHRKELVDKTVQKYGHIDIVVLNAAANPSVDNILNTKESVLDKLWEINIKTSILLLQAAAPYLWKGSSVIFISSIAGYSPQQSMAMYGVTKTALLGLTKSKAIEDKTIIGRLGTTGDMAAAAAFLASDDASYITGETLVVAGGMPSRL